MMCIHLFFLGNRIDNNQKQSREKQVKSMYGIYIVWEKRLELMHGTDGSKSIIYLTAPFLAS